MPALRRDAVCLDDKLLYVRSTVLDLKGQAATTKEPRTKAGRRVLTMPDVVVDVLRGHRRRQLEDRIALGLGRPEADALVFPSTIGGRGAPAPFRTNGGMPVWRMSGSMICGTRTSRC